MSKPSALELAISKAAALPETAQEQIGREMLVRLQSLQEIGAAVANGLHELDAGLGHPLDVEEVLRRARSNDGAR